VSKGGLQRFDQLSGLAEWANDEPHHQVAGLDEAGRHVTAGNEHLSRPHQLPHRTARPGIAAFSNGRDSVRSRAVVNAADNDGASVAWPTASIMNAPA
jgi:hypothetical protein